MIKQFIEDYSLVDKEDFEKTQDILHKIPIIEITKSKILKTLALHK